jgi:uncharacterized protein
MGCCDSPAQHGGHGGICAAGDGVVETTSSHSGVKTGHSLSAWVLLIIVRFYVLFLSPIFGGACRFYPSCSNYAYEAIVRHGARRGAWLSVKRLLRCQPFCQGGFDPVPEIRYEQDALQEPKSLEKVGVEIASSERTHRPTQPVIAEAWSAAGTLNVERRL